MVNKIHNGGYNKQRELYFQFFPEIKQFQDDTRANAKKELVQRTKLGRIRGVQESASSGSLLNFPLQSNASDGFKKALVKIHKSLEQYDAQLVHTQHDEVIVEVREEQVQEVESIVKKGMESAFEDIVPGVPFRVKSRISTSWA